MVLDVDTRSMVTLAVYVVPHPHFGLVPPTSIVRRTGTKPGEVTSRTYVPGPPRMEQAVWHCSVIPPAPETATVDTGLPDGLE